MPVVIADQLLIEVVPGEVAGPAPAAGRPAGGGDQVVGRLGAAIGKTCHQLIKAAREQLTATPPNELTIEFGVVLAGEGGAPMLTRRPAESSIVVKATWKH